MENTETKWDKYIFPPFQVNQEVLFFYINLFLSFMLRQSLIVLDLLCLLYRFNSINVDLSSFHLILGGDFNCWFNPHLHLLLLLSAESKSAKND